MEEILAILLLAAIGLLWADSLRARERAVRAGRSACEHSGTSGSSAASTRRRSKITMARQRCFAAQEKTSTWRGP